MHEALILIKWSKPNMIFLDTLILEDTSGGNENRKNSLFKDPIGPGAGREKIILMYNMLIINAVPDLLRRKATFVLP